MVEMWLILLFSVSFRVGGGFGLVFLYLSLKSKQERPAQSKIIRKLFDHKVLNPAIQASKATNSPTDFKTHMPAIQTRSKKVPTKFQHEETRKAEDQSYVNTIFNQ